MACYWPLFIFVLAMSEKVVLAKSFSCMTRNENPKSGAISCKITGVVAKDSIVLTAPLTPQLTIADLQIVNSTMDDIPSISSDNFLNLTGLVCTRCGLKDIKESSFTSLNHLQILDISHGSYLKLQKNLFGQLSSLTLLIARQGAITEVDDTAFTNLTKLFMLQLGHNNISKITPHMFAPLESLCLLDLSHNQISVLDEGLFMNNTNLMSVHLTHNHINRIDGRLFNPQHLNGEIRLSHNELTTLDTVNLNVRLLNAKHNKIKELFISNTHEMSLEADGNYIEKVICKEKGSTIRTLSLANNSLTELGCIPSLTQLIELDLSYNNLDKVNRTSFAALTKLTELYKLDISYNRMGNNAVKLAFPAKSLGVLYVHGNNITEFAYNDLKTNFKNLTLIGIGSNDFNCTFLEQAVDQLYRDRIIAIGEISSSVDFDPIMDISCRDKNETTTLSSFAPRTHSDDKNIPNDEEMIAFYLPVERPFK